MSRSVIRATNQPQALAHRLNTAMAGDSEAASNIGIGSRWPASLTRPVSTRQSWRRLLRSGLQLLLASLAIITTTAGAAEATDNPAVHEYKLRNGLKLIVKEDHRAPVVVSQIWYKVGSAYEHSGITGISHVLEHMMFKGTRKVKAGQFSRIISINGGRENAFTGQDYTAYFQQLANDRLAISLRLEADRMRGLLLPEDEFKKELQVVMEERRLRTDDDPQSLLYEQFNAAAFVNSPYHNPIIGWMDDLKHLQVNDLKAWYQHWYAPNNATLVIVGDVNPEQAHTLVKRYFGRIQPLQSAPLKPRRETEQHGIRRITVEAPAEVPYLILGYKTPVLRTLENKADAYALEVLAGILDGGNSARLSRDLIRGQQIAASASAGYDMYSGHDGLFLLDGTPAPEHTISDLEQQLRAQIQQLREHPVSAQELDRVKAQVVASAVYERDSVFYQAMQIGMLESVGLDWRLIDKYVDRIRAVTAEQIQRVANKYLDDQRLTVAVLNPLPLSPGQHPGSFSHGGAHVH